MIMNTKGKENSLEQKSNNELSDHHLDAVVGGTSFVVGFTNLVVGVASGVAGAVAGLVGGLHSPTIKT
jgi:hypothetical protein